MKPHFKLVKNEPVPVTEAETPLDRARRKFGRPFCFESGGNWIPGAEPCLSRWSRRASYFNTNPALPRLPNLICHFHEKDVA